MGSAGSPEGPARGGVHGAEHEYQRGAVDAADGHWALRGAHSSPRDVAYEGDDRGGGRVSAPRGFPCFFVSLAFIGGVTAIVEQVATVFGCAIGLNDTTTAITFVALGTSLPDTFASKQAAMESNDADAAIGNVTGSNSVNVFLGLGLPWVIASMYYGATGRDFQVKAGSLGFSVGVFCICATVCITMLLVRRQPAFGGGELGGSAASKRACAALLLSLWFFYVVLSAMQSYDLISV